MIKELLLIFLCTAALLTAHNSNKKISHNDNSQTENILESKPANKTGKNLESGVVQESMVESSTAAKIPKSGIAQENTIAGVGTETSPVAQTQTEKKDDSYYNKKYLPVIEEYRSLKYNNWTPLDDEKKFLYITDSIVHGLQEGCNSIYNNEYDFVDINNNGSAEMIVSAGSYLCAIYTLNEGIPLAVTAEEDDNLYYKYMLIELGGTGDIIEELCAQNGNHDHYNFLYLDKDDHVVKKESSDIFYSPSTMSASYFINDEEVSEKDYFYLMHQYGISGELNDNIITLYKGHKKF